MNNAIFFNFLDYVYILATFISLLSGIFKGFTRVFFSLCAWIVSGFISVKYAPYVLDVIDPYFSSHHIAQAVSLVTTYVLILMLLLIITRKISNRVKKSSLSDMDRVAGGAFGFIRGLALPIGICFAFMLLHIDYSKFNSVKNSQISSFLFELQRELFPDWSSSNVVSYLEKQREDLKKMYYEVKDSIKNMSSLEDEKDAV